MWRSLSVADGTVCKLLCLHSVLFDELQSKCRLIFRRFVIEIVDFLFRTDEFLGLAMAFKTPSHLERLRSPGQRHKIDIAMTRLTGHAFGNVYRMIEVDEVRKIMDANPFQRLAGLIACANRLEYWCIAPNLGVTGHAGVRWRNSSEGGFLNGGMAVRALNSKSIVVVLVAERNRLLPRNILVGHIPRPVHFLGNITHRGEYNESRNDTRARDDFETGMKYLGHLE